MLKINPLSTLYVGIDVSSKSNYVCALDFYKNKYINSSFANNQPGAEELVNNPGSVSLLSGLRKPQIRF